MSDLRVAIEFHFKDGRAEDLIAAPTEMAYAEDEQRIKVTVDRGPQGLEELTAYKDQLAFTRIRKWEEPKADQPLEV